MIITFVHAPAARACYVSLDPAPHGARRLSLLLASSPHHRPRTGARSIDRGIGDGELLDIIDRNGTELARSIDRWWTGTIYTPTWDTSS
jgi:hypothetical protein